MTRKRTSDNDILGSAGAAAPARRKTAARPRTQRAADPLPTLAPAEQDALVPQADAAIAYVPTREQIAALAYSYWEARGCQGGCPEEDWIRAEDELRNRSASVAVA